MRRKDGRPKARAPRRKPIFQYGFRDNPLTEGIRHPSWSGGRPDVEGHRVVSLFAGCGGLDLGFTGGFRYLGAEYPPLPFHIAFAADNSADAVETYMLNLGDHVMQQDLSVTDLRNLPPADILLGGFPCQDFSSSGTKTGFAHPRGQLYQVLVDYMVHHRPLMVIAENVPHLARLHSGRYLSRIISDMEGVGYRFAVWELYAPDYGLPQSRRRLFIVGVRDDVVGFPEPPKPTHLAAHVPVEEALADLESIDDESVPNQSQFFLASKATTGGGQGDHTNRVGEVAYCIRANARGRIQFHYSLSRRLTVRECARLQSFPDEFVFPYTTQRNLGLIGNAVPPILAFHVASAVQTFLETPPQERSAIGHPRYQARLFEEDIE